MEMTIENVETVIEKQIKNGQIFGLKKWDGRTAKVVIIKGNGDA